MIRKEIVTRHIEKLETCHTRIKKLLEDWYTNQNERQIDDSLQYVKECERATEYLNNIISLEDD